MAKQVTILDKSDAEDLLKRLEKVRWEKLKRGAQGRTKHGVLLNWLDELGLI